MDKLELDNLLNYLNSNRLAIYNATGLIISKDDDLSDVIDMLLSGEIDREDLFHSVLDLATSSLDLPPYFIDDNKSIYNYENYFPGDKAIKGEETWIKVWNDEGTKYELHRAKHYSPKHSANVRFHMLQEKVPETEKELDKYSLDLMHLLCECNIPYTPYRVKIKFKSKSIILNPADYELVDISDYLEIIKVNGSEFIKFVTLTNTPIDKDKLFYLMSRGIPRNLAEIMTNLNNAYIKVDFFNLINNYNNSMNYILVEK